MKSFEEIRVDSLAVCQLLYTGRELRSSNVKWSSSTFTRWIGGRRTPSNQTISYDTLRPTPEWVKQMESTSAMMACGMREAAKYLGVDDVHISVGIEDRRRRYCNTESTRCDHDESWYDIMCSNEQRNEFVTDGTGNAQEVLALLLSCLTELDQRKRDSEIVHEIPNTCKSLVLAPTVAAVLFHELVGHGIEECGEELLGRRIGPPSLNVAAANPKRRCHDDEGIEPRRTEFVKEGVVVAGVADRESAPVKRIAPTGTARSASHGKGAKARCTYLEIGEGPIASKHLNEVVEQGLWCTGVLGAHFSGGVANVQVSEARIIESGRIGKRVGRFRFSASLSSLASKLTVICNDAQRGRAARCTKHSESVPTVNTAPTVLLQDVPIISDSCSSCLRRRSYPTLP